MKDNRRKKMWLDAVILVASCVWVALSWYCEMSKQLFQVSIVLAILIAGAALVDIIRLADKTDYEIMGDEQLVLAEQAATSFPVYELALLNEDDKPIRSWNLTGKTAVIIGRAHKDMDVDVDLSDCEYSALINLQHAVMNYCLDSWYLEDLGSQNGIQIKKVDDGKCYQVASSHPCKVSAGDVIYIAKTKLLFT